MTQNALIQRLASTEGVVHDEYQLLDNSRSPLLLHSCLNRFSPTAALNLALNKPTGLMEDISNYPFREIKSDLDSTESLMRYFCEKTCGILAITEDPSENPWRSIVLPAIFDSPALFHGVVSMGALHLCNTQSSSAVTELAHRMHTISLLNARLRNEEGVTELAVVIILALTSKWNQDFLGEYLHLKGATRLLGIVLLQLPNMSPKLLVCSAFSTIPGLI